MDNVMVCICGRVMGYADEHCDGCNGEPHEDPPVQEDEGVNDLLHVWIDNGWIEG